MDRHSRELVSNNDRDGYGSVTKKVNSRCFKLYFAYSVIPSRSIRQMFVLFSGVEFRKNCVEVRSTSVKENESCCLAVLSSTEREVIILSWDESCR